MIAQTAHRFRHSVSALSVALALAAGSARAADLPSMKDAAAPPVMDMDAMGPPPPATLTWTMVAAPGQFMFNYMPSFMGMSGNYIGANKVSDAYITANIPSAMMVNGKLVNLHIVPESMNVDMQMFGGMYGVTDNLTLMAMGGYVSKSMSMTSYAMTMPTKVLGSSSGTDDGLADTTIGANDRIYHDGMNSVVFGLNLNLPTGSQTRQITMLSPMNDKMMVMRAPYGMQSGTGTFDLMPSLAYTGHLGPWSWGLGYRGRFALDNNAEGYRWGDLHEFHGWGGYTLFPGVTTTLHVVGSTQGHIEGSDPAIMGLAQNANPLYYGGQRVTLLGGVELSGALWGYSKSSLSVEAGAPVYQNLNGPQIGQAWQVTVSARVMY